MDSALTTDEYYNLLNIFKDLLDQFDTKTVATMLAVNNIFQYKFGREVNFISEQNEQGLRIYNDDAVKELLNPNTVIFSILGIKTILQKFCANFCYVSRTKIFQVRLLLSKLFNIFDLEERDTKNPKNRTRKPNPCSQFDAVRSAVFAKAAEQTLFSRGVKLLGESTEENTTKAVPDEDLVFPKHKFFSSVMFVRKLLNGIFNQEPSTHNEEVEAPVVETVSETETSDDYRFNYEDYCNKLMFSTRDDDDDEDEYYYDDDQDDYEEEPEDEIAPPPPPQPKPKSNPIPLTEIPKSKWVDNGDRNILIYAKGAEDLKSVKDLDDWEKNRRFEEDLLWNY